MSPAALGKRTRSAAEAALVETPSKRSRHHDAYAVGGGDEENDDPDAELDSQEDKVVQELPRKRQRAASTTKENPVTPSTPRHRDAFSRYPDTPRHTVMSAGKLFRRMTPQSPLTPSTIQTVYQSARQLFARGAEPGQLIGRESERSQLAAFLDRCSSDSPHGCLYVSGAPGTGKSAMITEMTKQGPERAGVRSAFINCMSIKSSKDLYTTLLAELGFDGNVSEADAVSALQQAFCPKSKQPSAVYQVTLDEIDHILTMGLESLYRIFEWSLHASSRLVLIGIANALDLTERFLPRLKSKNLKADLLPFLPYTAAQVKNIIMTRLKSLMPADKQSYVPFLHPAAIELCSRKVSSQTGDLRKAFEICRRALDLIEAETRCKHEEEAREKLLQMTPSKKPLGEKVNGAAATSGPRSVMETMTASLKALTAETAPRASIGHLNKVTAAAFSNGTNQRLKTLNLQQKAALSALVAYENRARSVARSAGGSTASKSQSLAPTIKMLFDAYCQLCTRDSLLHPLSSSEFREVVGSLETLGLVNTVFGKSGSFGLAQTPSKRGRKGTAGSGDDRRIASSVSDKDMESVVDGVGAGILKSILAGEALD
ncbi:cell division control protein Cdc6 [Drechmeria coniospora]|uniref:Cell division control protein n=1 Tax=Drechmeria coniospora TaxID=98403 RepID=A0A151GES2_DRECN|nr:cell division control protein Cdc6 [Drechmeria coniospora]KYK55597.1 cell division control protein Cdc6 [Drechmeria coniospora]